MKSLIRFDRAAFAGALRTAGALMIGNVFVGVTILDNRNWPALASLLMCGSITIILTSIQRKE